MELTMSKKRILEAMEKLPEDATVEEAMYKLYVLDQVSKSIRDQGPKIPHEQAKRQILGSR